MKITLQHEGETFSIENDAITAGYAIGSFLRLMLAAGWSRDNLDSFTDCALADEKAWTNKW